MKSYGVTIQMKPLEQYFNIVLYQKFLTCLELLEFSFWELLGVKG